MTTHPSSPPDDVFVLGFDTAMDSCQAAIVSRTGHIVAKAHEEMKRGHAEALIPMIGAVLEAAELGLEDLTRIGVTVGPGTFAGLRVGLSAARGFGLSHDIPIVGVSTLEAVAVTLPEPEADQPLRAGVIAFDARNDEVYLQIVDPLGTLVVAPSVIDLKTAAEAVPEGLVNLSGSGAPKLADALAALERSSDVAVVDESLCAPQAEWIARPALVAPDDRVGPPSPLYLRPPDAKEPENGGALPHA